MSAINRSMFVAILCAFAVVHQVSGATRLPTRAPQTSRPTLSPTLAPSMVGLHLSCHVNLLAYPCPALILFPTLPHVTLMTRPLPLTLSH